jgi:hypothetical protein
MNGVNGRRRRINHPGTLQSFTFQNGAESSISEHVVDWTGRPLQRTRLGQITGGNLSMEIHLESYDRLVDDDIDGRKEPERFLVADGIDYGQIRRDVG